MPPGESLAASEPRQAASKSRASAQSSHAHNDTRPLELYFFSVIEALRVLAISSNSLVR